MLQRNKIQNCNHINTVCVSVCIHAIFAICFFMYVDMNYVCLYFRFLFQRIHIFVYQKYEYTHICIYSTYCVCACVCVWCVCFLIYTYISICLHFHRVSSLRSQFNTICAARIALSSAQFSESVEIINACLSKDPQGESEHLTHASSYVCVCVPCSHSESPTLHITAYSRLTADVRCCNSSQRALTHPNIIPLRPELHLTPN